MAVTKADLALTIVEQVGLNKRESTECVELFFDCIKNSLIEGDNVKFSGFGNFVLRDKSARPGRNPRTGESIPITARRVVTYRPSQKFKKMIEDNSDYLRTLIEK